MEALNKTKRQGQRARIDLDTAVKAAYRLGLMDGKKDAEKEMSREFQCMKIANRELMGVLMAEHQHTRVSFSLNTVKKILHHMPRNNLTRPVREKVKIAYDFAIGREGCVDES